jgi:hypothetical protein
MGMQTRWWVTVWSTPPGEHYRETGHGSVESVGKVKETEYKTKAGAERGAQIARDKYEGPPINWYVELVSGGRLVIDDDELRDALR